MQGEYRGDFTRDTFDPVKHLSRVLSQQGRVHLDADGNEQTAILLHFLRNLAADLIGQHGGPSNSAAFAISALPAALGATNDFQIGTGTYYVDGVLCEVDSCSVGVIAADAAIPISKTVVIANAPPDGPALQRGEYLEIFRDVPGSPMVVRLVEVQEAGTRLILSEAIDLTNASDVRLRRAITYRTQPDWPVPSGESIAADPSGSSKYLIYVDVWERHLTCVEDSGIREVGLGGPDTATRAKVVWQVKATPKLPAFTGSLEDKDLAWRHFVAAHFQPEHRGRLTARVRPRESSTDPCITSPKSEYRGAENQLYRVEVHQGGTLGAVAGARPPSFKWSRENGSVAFAVSRWNGPRVILENPGHDRRLGLQIGDVVEVVDDTSTLQGKAEPLLRVIGIDGTGVAVTLSGVPKRAGGEAPTKHALLRRWDHRPGESKADAAGLADEDNAVNVVESSTSEDVWLSLEEGIEIQFQRGATYRTGDYWLIPARVATGDIEWPKLRDGQGRLVPDAKGRAQSVALPPHGVEHHYAPLAVVTIDSQGKVTQPPTELRRKFKPAGR